MDEIPSKPSEPQSRQHARCLHVMSELLRCELQTKPVWFEVQGNSCAFSAHHTLCSCRRLQHTALPTATGSGTRKPLTADSPARFSTHSAVTMPATTGCLLRDSGVGTLSPAANTSHRSILDLHPHASRAKHGRTLIMFHMTQVDVYDTSTSFCWSLISALVSARVVLGRTHRVSVLKCHNSRLGFVSLGFVGRCRADNCLHG